MKSLQAVTASSGIILKRSKSRYSDGVEPLFCIRFLHPFDGSLTRHGPGLCGKRCKTWKNKIGLLKLKSKHSNIWIRMARQRTRKMLRASRVMHSYPPISAHAIRFWRTNELLSIQPVLLGIDWIPLILWFPLPSEKKLRPSPMTAHVEPVSAEFRPRQSILWQK